MNYYPKDSAIRFRNTYSLDSDLSGGYPTFEQPGPVSRIWATSSPFLESPGNFTGPKSNIQIEI